MKKYKLKYLFTVLFLISSFTIFSGNLQTVNVVATDLHLHATPHNPPNQTADQKHHDIRRYDR